MASSNLESPSKELLYGEMQELLKAFDEPCCAKCRYWDTDWSTLPRQLPFVVAQANQDKVDKPIWKWVPWDLVKRLVVWNNACVRYPPSVRTACPDSQVLTLKGSVWPMTKWSEWCGEYQPRARAARGRAKR